MEDVAVHKNLSQGLYGDIGFRVSDVMVVWWVKTNMGPRKVGPVTTMWFE